MENQSASTNTIGTDAEKQTQPTTSKILLNRPGPETKGIVDWLTTVDHKKIGVMYGMVALICLIIGGIEALLMRVQLASPEATFLTAREYNQLFNMHGTTMIFLAVMPLSVAFFNFLIPLQIGARRVAFPRINTLSLWCFISGAIILNMSWLFPTGVPVIGWFGHAPITLKMQNGDMGMHTDFWIIGLQVLGLAYLLASFNFITTIINMRCQGMTMMRLPVFTWMTLFTSFLLVLAFPAITIELFELMFDSQFGTLFFENTAGSKAIFWQHLFWIFGHTEVYIFILPAMGIISEVLPTFSRKPLLGYSWIIFSGATIGFLGYSVWSHHMFTTGLGVVATSAFSILTMLMAIPSGIKIFNWIGTIWGGSIRYSTPMLFALGFISMFMIGGFTGIMHSTASVGAQHQDSYFHIAHFHYVLIGGSIFALLAGFYYWIPKLTGAMMNDHFGKLCFTLIFAGFNLTFFPMHYLGMEGMRRRTHTYHADMGWDDPNKLASIGAFILGFGILFSMIQVFHTVINRRKLPQAGEDPWDARTLEWTTPSPVPVYNFSRTPIVKTRDQFWEDKYGSEELKMEYVPPSSMGIHIPDRSWWPMFTGIGIFLLGFGLIARKMQFHLPEGITWEPNFEIVIVGCALTLMSIIKWSLEGPGGYHLHPGRESDVRQD
jgi:cytochrome c oxidase subunit 1